MEKKNVVKIEESNKLLLENLKKIFAASEEKEDTPWISLDEAEELLKDRTK